MPKSVKNKEWFRLGRSGDTIDGRKISASDIQQAADTYDTNFYTALIWPDHKRWFNMGKVVAVRAEDNDEGGKDLFGQIQANDIYRSMNAAGQRLFTSMELFPNFRNSDKTYLSGLGATDEPASVATSEVHLSRIDEPEVLVAEFYEASPVEFDESPNDEAAKSLLASITKLFKNQSSFNEQAEDDMSKAAIEKLQSDLAELTEKFTEISNSAPDTSKTASDDKSNLEEQVTMLSNQVKELAEKFSTIDRTKTQADDPAPTKEDFSELKTALDDLTEKFKSALKEQPGTEGGEHNSESKDLSDYV